MSDKNIFQIDRRFFLKAGLAGVAVGCAPTTVKIAGEKIAVSVPKALEEPVGASFRKGALFAGIRKPIQKREELKPRIEELKSACEGKIAGPLTHIFRFDTPVEGFDSEIGFPVSAEVNVGDIKSHMLRDMHFFTARHNGPVDKIRETTGSVYEYMNTVGLSPELELAEIYHNLDDENPGKNDIEVMASFLAWPEVYKAELTRVLGPTDAEKIWLGGEKITPYTKVDERCDWVAASISRLKEATNTEQQFDILSRVALKRPMEEIQFYKDIYAQAKDISAVFQTQEERLKKTPTGGFLDPPRFDGKILHVSKVPYNKEAYVNAKTPEEKRKAYCFCALIREAKNPTVDPIFCYRAAGWARQMWEPVLGVQFKRCTITNSILKGDGFCAWDYEI